MKFLTTKGSQVEHNLENSAIDEHSGSNEMQARALSSEEFIAMLQDAFRKNKADGLSVEQCARILWPDNKYIGGVNEQE